MRLVFIFLTVTSLLSCTATETSNRYIPQNYVNISAPDWTKNAVLYQLNTRQFTEAGTFAAAEAELPRLKEFGVDIIWLMPIHPIGEQNRKGSLGSPYAVKDYFGVNPEFGTMDDLKSFVKSAHKLGMKVILDWVANHTAWDNPIREQHPEWYERDYKGDYRPTPWWDWSDIIDLDYNQPEMRRYMTEALTYWVKEADIDGYRCDVAGFVPVDFWDNVRAELDAIKPVLMLAEWESRDLHANAFDMTYAWSWREKMHQIAHGQADVNALFIYYSWNESAFPEKAYRMTYVSNHDTNAWEGTMYEAFGDALEATTVLSFVGEGFPMIYNGQEAGNARRLAFFEKDPIDWRPDPMGTLYKKLIQLKHQNSAIWNGHHGARMIRVPNSAPDKVFSFVRQNAEDKVFVVMNLSKETQQVSFGEVLFHGSYTEYFTAQTSQLNAQTQLTLPAWSYRVFVK